MDRHEEVEHDYKPVAIIAWCIAGGGMYMLARVFQALAVAPADYCCTGCKKTGHNRCK